MCAWMGLWSILDLSPVITPIKKIVDPVAGKEFTYGDGKNPGPVCTELFTKYTAIQFGEAEDPFGWTEVVDV